MRRLICVALVLAVLVGCTAPNRAVITAADSFVNETVGPEYEEYLATGKAPDGSVLSETDLRIRRANVMTFRLVVEEAKNAGP